MRVENLYANELLLDARKGQRTKEFMDAVSGVPDYKIGNAKKQGHIRDSFSKELISEQFLLNFEDIISVFWTGVYEYLDKAKLFGEQVEVKAPGEESEFRATNNNPIHYLRYHGRMAVRNYITSLYRRNLQQGCSECGYKSPIKTDKACPKLKCLGVMSTVYKFVVADDNSEEGGAFILSTPPSQANIENVDMTSKLDRMLKQFAEEVLKEGTRAYQILKILTEPDASKDMCGACGLCDADTFDIDSCTNYSANIGKYLEVNKTMIASKVRRIRTAFVNWVYEQDSSEAQRIAGMIPAKFKSLRIVNR